MTNHTECPRITWSNTDMSSYTDDGLLGYVNCLVSEKCPTTKPTFIRNHWHFMAVFGHDLTDCRIYLKGYLDKVMVSGINKDGERVHVFFQKQYKRGKYARKKLAAKSEDIAAQVHYATANNPQGD